MRISLAELTGLIDRALAKFGHSPADAALIREILLYAELRGNAQGLLKIAERAILREAGAEPPLVVSRTAATARIDGRRANGMVVMGQAADLAVELAAHAGIGAVGSFNTGTSTGAIGYFADRIARAGLIGVAMSGTPKVTAMEGSNEPVFGTNPLAIGIPMAQAPMVLDITTSAMAWFSLIEAREAGRSIAPDIGYDKDGAATKDPAAILKGALRAFGGHRGAGLALMVEILTGALVGGDLPGEIGKPPSRGNLLLAIDPGAFGDSAEFLAKIERLATHLRTRRRNDVVVPIRLPGERSAARAAATLAAGAIDLPDGLVDALRKEATSG